MTEAASVPTQIHEVHLASFVSFCSGLAAALREAGFTESQLSEILTRHVRAECVECGIQITGEDLAQIALRADQPAVPESRLGRLARGYCARNGCPSYYYRASFGDYPNLDWTKIREKAASQSLAAQTAAEIDAGTGSNAFRNWLLIRLGAGIVGVLILLLFWHIKYYGYVPILQKPHRYAVDPASVPKGP